MPLYEYRCLNCKQITEVLAKFSDPAPEACEKCQQGPLEKMVSQTSFILKGGGWYVSDYKPKPKEASSSTPTTSTSTATNGTAGALTSTPSAQSSTVSEKSVDTKTSKKDS